MSGYTEVLNHKLYQNAFFLMSNSLARALLGFCFWNLMARYFRPAEVGIGSALVAAAGLVAVLGSLGLGAGLIRFVPEAGAQDGRLLNAACTWSATAVLFVVLIYLWGVHYWSPALRFLWSSPELVLLFAVAAVAMCWSSLVDQALLARREARLVLLKNSIIGLAALPLPVLVFGSLGGAGIFAGTGLAVAGGVLLAGCVFLPMAYPGYHPRLLWSHGLSNRVLPYSLANYAAVLFSSAPGFVYPLMVLNVLGAEQSAYFYIALMMSLIITIIPAGMAQSLFAEGSHDPVRVGRHCRRVLGLALVLTLPAVGAINLLGGWLLGFFGPGYAEQGTLTLRLLSLAALPMSVNLLFITMNQVQKRLGLVIAQTIFLSILALALGYWLLLFWGMAGVGLAFALAHLLVAVTVFVPLWRCTRPAGEERDVRSEANYSN